MIKVKNPELIRIKNIRLYNLYGINLEGSAFNTVASFCGDGTGPYLAWRISTCQKSRSLIQRWLAFEPRAVYVLMYVNVPRIITKCLSLVLRAAAARLPTRCQP